jgi:hypothetical protein
MEVDSELSEDWKSGGVTAKAYYKEKGITVSLYRISGTEFREVG